MRLKTRSNMESERILVPVCGGEVSEQTFRWACQLARKSKSQLYALHVIEVPMSLPLEGASPESVDNGERILARMEAIGYEEKCKDVHARSVRARQAGPAIVVEAEDRGVNAVVLGIPYRRRFGVCMVGNTANYVLDNAPCQVIFSRQGVPEHATV